MLERRLVLAFYRQPHVLSPSVQVRGWPLPAPIGADKGSFIATSGWGGWHVRAESLTELPGQQRATVAKRRHL